jgi:hypothetical protein
MERKRDRETEGRTLFMIVAGQHGWARAGADRVA